MSAVEWKRAVMAGTAYGLISVNLIAEMERIVGTVAITETSRAIRRIESPRLMKMMYSLVPVR